MRSTFWWRFLVWWSLFHFGFGKRLTRASWWFREPPNRGVSSHQSKCSASIPSRSSGPTQPQSPWTVSSPQLFILLDSLSKETSHYVLPCCPIANHLLVHFFLFSFSVLDNIEFRAPRWPWTLNPPALTSKVLASLAGATTSGLTLCLPTVLNHQRNPFLLCHHSVLFLRNIMWDSPERAILLGHKMWPFVLILGFTNLISSLLNIFQMTIIKYFTLCIKNTHVVVKARCQTYLSFSIIFKNKFFWVFANMCVYIPCVWLVPSDLLQLPLRIVVSYDMAAKNWIRFSARRATHWLNHLSSSSILVFETLYFMEPEAHSLG